MKSPLYVTVVPLRRMPTHLSRFTYGVPEALIDKVDRGSVVSMPFKNSLIHGVVVESAISTEIAKVKFIEGIIPLRMSRSQQTLAAYAAYTYIQSLSSIYRSFVPAIPKRQVNEGSELHTKKTRSGTSASLKPSIPQGYLLYNSKKTFLRYIEAYFKKISRDSQVLIIVPEHEEQRHIGSALAAAGIQDILMIPTRQNKKAYFEAWERSARARIVIGPLTALFFPWTNLAHIIVPESEQQALKQADQNPRYHLHELLWKVADTYRASVLLGGYSPDIRLLYEVKQRTLPVKQLGKNTPVQIVKRTYEQMKGMAGLTQESLDLIRASKLSCVIFNRLGDSRQVRCSDCGYYPLCDRCERPLLVDTDARRMACSLCDFSQDLIVVCPRCHGVRLKNIGRGIGTIVRKLRSEFPEKTVAEVTSKMAALPNPLMSEGIFVGSNKIFTLRTKDFDAAVMVDPDADAHLPIVSAGETMRHYIQKLRSRSSVTLLQTDDPNQLLYMTLDSVGAFYEDEIRWRKEFLYPPFGEVARVWIRNARSGEVSKQVGMLLDQLRGIEYFGPYMSKSRGAFEGSVVIRYGARSEHIHTLLQRLSVSYNIEINPYQTL